MSIAKKVIDGFLAAGFGLGVATVILFIMYILYRFFVKCANHELCCQIRMKLNPPPVTSSSGLRTTVSKILNRHLQVEAKMSSSSPATDGVKAAVTDSSPPASAVHCFGFPKRDRKLSLSEQVSCRPGESGSDWTSCRTEVISTEVISIGSPTSSPYRSSTDSVRKMWDAHDEYWSPDLQQSAVELGTVYCPWPLTVTRPDHSSAMAEENLQGEADQYAYIEKITISRSTLSPNALKTRLSSESMDDI